MHTSDSDVKSIELRFRWNAPALNQLGRKCTYLCIYRQSRNATQPL